jgi:hypothetical protein
MLLILIAEAVIHKQKSLAVIIPIAQVIRDSYIFLRRGTSARRWLVLAVMGSIALIASLHVASSVSSQSDDFSQRFSLPVSLDEDQQSDEQDMQADDVEIEGGAQNAYSDAEGDSDSADGDGDDDGEPAAPAIPPCSGPTCYMQGAV